MFSPRYLFRLVIAFISRFKLVIILGLFFGVLLFLIINWLMPVYLSTQTKRIGMTGKYSIDSLPDEVLNLVGEGLTKINTSGEIIPGLAKSWETKDNGKLWLFHLDSQRVWQDGKKVVSQDINFKFTDAEIQRPDGQTIIFKLQSAFAPFASVVAQPIFKKGLLGTGQWKVLKATMQGSSVQGLTIKNNKKEKIIFKFYPNEERTKLAFKLGQIDQINKAFASEPFDQWKNVKISGQSVNDNILVVFLNTTDKVLGEDAVRFRQALAYAIDKDKIGGERAVGPIPPYSWAYNPQVKPYNYDLSKAKQLLNDSPKYVKENPNIKLSTPSFLLPVAEKISRDWAAIGVKTDIQVVSTTPDDYQALLAIFQAPKDPDQYFLWHSTQQTNISHYKNVRIDKLLEDGRMVVNQEERKRIYLDFQRFLLEDSPAIFLTHPVFYTIERK